MTTRSVVVVRGVTGYGDPMPRLATMELDSPLTAAEIERITGRIDKTGRCWIWRGTIDCYGYGRIKLRGRDWKAHRLVWLIEKGHLPQGLVGDHQCEDRSCVRPACVTMTTNEVNVMRGASPHALNARKQLCPSGHPYQFRVNRRMRKGWQRYCPICQRSEAPASA